MKRNLSVLRKPDIRAIKKWLKSNRGERLGWCPFGWKCDRCLAIFPSLPDFGSLTLCPCGRFDIKYVTKVARQIVNDLG